MTERVRKLVDDTLDGNLNLTGEYPEMVNAIRALSRAVRINADAIDDIEARLATFNARLATVGGGIIVSIISAAILLALRTG